MKEFLTQLKISVVATVVFAVLLCGVYPLAVWAIGQVAFPYQANGEQLTDKSGTVVGSQLIGQEFTLAKYFHPRPSNAGVGYDPTASSGTNLGPTSKKLAGEITQNIAAYRSENNLAANASVPADAVTASASGLDPEISVENAQLQAPRVAASRGLSLAEVKKCISDNTDTRGLGIFGEEGVNVLKLNLALDALNASK